MTKACLDKEPLFSSIHKSSSFGIRININTSINQQTKSRVVYLFNLFIHQNRIKD
ncbi:hypothetical protein barba126A_phanotate107 [Rheinheimera phage vB_RspM_barba_12-6A]|jgi:hypothetical protein|uniref:Uncharacterized protein n=31 Tax=Barbavirus barba18A TaxID=2734090 RepID=A0A7G9VRW7_9CAUD|nr:hypothetical protein barba13A_phanotate54 [Rheinheimera phage vB_RspM_barba_1-3A]QNO01598.1 hypothetical protein barba108A_phanotate87 [Rheinheimera phage vB_RspM_barba_10-8A]QNO01725.1 hypothetical protein barba108B_phanotate54 [Rheinheimera phage vB_RspM_barba_10-8B]QNO01919.1 hypothetical protein barba108D_phanotate88 [Rheinheimera phage vB_RspM_barba_10-8D]QNO02050.1 hypothetical protein barba109A_phanotate58 [Rheinheimera phage vB_RspM_barba_10-9A]QNO02216.1 hypothetical protein barba1